MSELTTCPICGGATDRESIERFKAENRRPLMHRTSDLYVLYHGDELQAVGTAHELADFMGVKLETFYWYTYPSAQKRCRNAKRPRFYVERIEEE